jgi:HlyD family secretion protein
MTDASYAPPRANLAASLDDDFRSYARFGYKAIVAVFGGFWVWASFAPLDSAAIAPGRVAVESDRKPIQHLEGGIIQEILVKEAQKVNQGDVLFRLQPIQAQANAETIKKQLDAALAIEARLLAERDGAAKLVFPKELLDRRHVLETATAISDQQSQFQEHRRTLTNQIDILKNRIEQTTRDISGRRLRVTALQSQVTSYDDEMRNVAPLLAKGLYVRPKFLALQREHSRLTGELGLTKSEIDKMSESIEESRLQIRQAQQQYAETAAQQLADVRVKISDAREKTTVASDVLTRVEIRAPYRGIVQAIKVFGNGAIVRPGETMAEIIPVGDNLILSARVSPLDIHNVMVGQKAEVKFHAFVKIAPAMWGKVESISADSMIDEATKLPYYQARVVIDHAKVPKEIESVLVAGMPADVLINTGERTMAQYLLGPLYDRMAKTMREK